MRLIRNESISIGRRRKRGKKKKTPKIPKKFIIEYIAVSFAESINPFLGLSIKSIFWHR